MIRPSLYKDMSNYWLEDKTKKFSYLLVVNGNTETRRYVSADVTNPDWREELVTSVREQINQLRVQLGDVVLPLHTGKYEDYFLGYDEEGEPHYFFVPESFVKMKGVKYGWWNTAE